MSIYDPHAFHIYTDGSALKNPGPGGLAAVLEFPADIEKENHVILQEGYRETTNNRMELRAVIKALEYARKNARSLNATRFVIVTDSLYVSENQDRASYWKQDGWKGSEGQSIENPDLWKDFLSIERKVGVPTSVVWHKGKKTEILKHVDSLAKTAAKNPILTDVGFRVGKIGKAETDAEGASALFPARGQCVKIKIYRKKPLSNDEHKVFFTVFSEIRKSYFEKYHAYVHPALAVELHRFHRYMVEFNNILKHPVILSIIEESKPEAVIDVL